MKRRLWLSIMFLFLFWIVFFGNCLIFGADAATSGLQELKFQGGVRTYILHLPKDSPKGKIPLLIALHGYTGTASNFENGTGFDAKADAGGFAVVYPNGTGNPQMWNAGLVWNNGIDDLGFISALIDNLAKRYPIDRNRIWVTGHSNGAYMAYRLATELSLKVVAIAPVAGSFLVIPSSNPERQVAILHLHALDDTTIPFYGGDLGGVYTQPVETTLAYWIKIQKCNPEPITVFNKDGVIGRRWKSRSGHGDVYLYTTTTGGHMWPRLTTGGLEATDLISKFFLDLPKRK